jgi:ABC-type nitrate/sulfonate/bicarbonate transport system substrate-binding protein
LLIWFGAPLVIIVIVLGVYVWSTGHSQNPTSPPEKMIIAVATAPVAGPVYVAVAKGYFAAEGLDVVLQPHPSGKAALNSVLEGKADLGTGGETPIMFAVMQGGKISVLATINTSEKSTMIVARKDRGISQPGELKGKKIGVTSGTTGQFFLDLLLISHRVPKEDIRLVNLKPEEMFDGLMKGDVDAVSTGRNPHTYRLQKELGDRAVTFYGEGIYNEMYNTVAAQAFVKEKPAAVRKVLRALVMATKFIAQNADESNRIIADTIEMDKSVLSELWNIYNFAVTLDQSLLTTIEDQARWAIKNKLTNQSRLPNYLDFIYLDGLKAVRPEGVTIIH